MFQTLNVGIADYKITKSPNLLMTAGLGSCVAVCIFDYELKLGGLAHVMLPQTPGNNKGEQKKYADVLVPLMYKDLLDLGAKKIRLAAKIAGGAQMFALTGASHTLKIGERNIEAVKHELGLLGVPILAEDVGGNFGRTVNFDVANGKLRIKTINYGEKVI